MIGEAFDEASLILSEYPNRQRERVESAFSASSSLASDTIAR